MKLQAFGHEALPREVKTAVFLGEAVFRISRDGTADMRKMRAYLMRLARMQDDLRQRIAPFPFQHPILRHDPFRARLGGIEDFYERLRFVLFQIRGQDVSLLFKRSEAGGMINFFHALFAKSF